jgi:hypothetical protein
MSGLVTRGLGAPQTIITLGLGGVAGEIPEQRKRRFPGGRSRRRELPEDLTEQWDIRLNIFGKEITLQENLTYGKEDDIKIELKDNNVIEEDIYNVTINSVKKKDYVIEESNE